MRDPELARRVADATGKAPSQALAAHRAAHSLCSVGRAVPRAAAIVHHGVIGTCARALKAGIPQLVMPMAYDQHDNAYRLGRLGVAKTIERSHFTAQNVASELRQLHESQTVLERCRYYARKFEGGTALESTCDYIEALTVEAD
jgi:rhamnosyltransferase subunit B